VESENDLDRPEQGLALINDGCRGGSAREAVTLGSSARLRGGRPGSPFSGQSLRDRKLAPNWSGEGVTAAAFEGPLAFDQMVELPHGHGRPLAARYFEIQSRCALLHA
jgi:hypothetical protein